MQFFLKKTCSSYHFLLPISLTLDKQKVCEGWDVWCDGIFETFRHPWSLSGCIKCFQQIKMNLYAHDCQTTQQSSGRGSRANEGQIYVYHTRDLSCFPYDDGCAATSKLSHNAGLNCSAITLFSVWKFNHCKVCAWLTSLSVHMATVYLLLQCAQIT